MKDKSNSVSNILNFDHMLTPHIITFVYWLCVIAVILIGFSAMYGGDPFVGAVTVVFGFLGVRIWCELMIVLFKINENIQKIAEK